MYKSNLAWCRICTTLIVILAIGSGCSLFDSGSSAVNPTDEQLRRVSSEVPAFGGVVFEGDQVVVFTRDGDLQAANDALLDIFGVQAAGAIDLRTRPAEGPVTQDQLEATRDELHQNEDVKGTGFAYGYVVVYVHTANAVKQAQQTVDASPLSLDDVTIQVTSPFVGLPGN